MRLSGTTIHGLEINHLSSISLHRSLYPRPSSLAPLIVLTARYERKLPGGFTVHLGVTTDCDDVDVIVGAERIRIAQRHPPTPQDHQDMSLAVQETFRSTVLQPSVQPQPGVWGCDG